MKRQMDLDADLAEIGAWLFGNSHAASAEMKEKLRGLWMAYYETKARSETLTEILVAASAKSLDIPHAYHAQTTREAVSLGAGPCMVRKN